MSVKTKRRLEKALWRYKQIASRDRFMDVVVAYLDRIDEGLDRIIKRQPKPRRKHGKRR